jgi:hypothetical protein
MSEGRAEVYPRWETGSVDLDVEGGLFIRGTIGESDQGAHYHIETICAGNEVGTFTPQTEADNWSMPFLFRSEAISDMRSEMVQLLLGHDASGKNDKEYSERVVDHAISYRIHLRGLMKKWLRNPDLWWEQLPVVRGEATDLGDQWGWHKHQLEGP